jgi:hypothetical protein
MSWSDNLPEHLRTAGVAWIVSESARNGVDRRVVHLRAHHWAVMREIECGDEASHEEATQDAIAYAAAHADDVAEFLRLREIARGP